MNKIMAPNYTQIPNVVFDYWMPILKPAAFTVLLCLCRKIFGWHKTSDKISRNQLVKCTGMSKNTVKAALDELEKHGLLEKSQTTNEYGNQPNQFKLRIIKPKDELYSEPPAGQKEGGDRSNVDQGVDQRLTKGVGQKVTTQKKDLTKERLTKENTQGGGEICPLGENGNTLLTEAEKQKLLKKMSAQELEYWIEEIDIAVGQAGGHKAFNQKYKIKTDTHFFTILSWKRKREADGKPIGKQTGSPASNLEHAKYVRENFAAMSQQRHVKIDVGTKYIEFVSMGGHSPSRCINYTEKGFKEQVENTLRKLEIMR